MVEEMLASGATKGCFLSTPSLFFSLPPDCPLRQASWVFDLDTQFGRNESNYFSYDFNKMDLIPSHLVGTFDLVVIDPPFITRDVWEKYAAAAKVLLSPGGKLMCTTIPENEDMLNELLGTESAPVISCAFRPLVPHLPYLYKVFLNFPPSVLHEKNPEIIED
jgi:hypothetical protein